MKTFAAAALATSTFLTLASAQQQYSIDPNNVPSALRANWCQSQTTSCPLICLQTSNNAAVTEQNTCDPDALTYQCVCGDGTTPNITMYTQTLPFFICQEWGNECVSNCGQDNTCAANCRQQHPCGAQSPQRQNTSTLSSTMMSSTTSGSPAGATVSGGQTIYTGFGGAAASSTGGDSGNGGAQQTAAAGSSGAGRAAALQAGQTFGLLALMGGLFGGFAVLL